jgi:hypothetical protein
MNRFIFVIGDDGVNVTYTITADSVATLKKECSNAAFAQTIAKDHVNLNPVEDWSAPDCNSTNSTNTSGTIYDTI